MLGLQGDWAVRVVIESSGNPVPEGACELPGGACQVMRESDCLCEDGTYYGDGTTSCSGTPTTGACCLPGGCLDLSETNCGIAGGTFLGLGTNCLPSPCSNCPSDVNDDNVVNVTDLLLLLAVWGPCPGCPEDINTNGTVDVSDLLQLLADWGPC